MEQQVLVGARKPFIEANTEEVSLQHLNTECIIPVFSKDNERTIAHQEFINCSISALIDAMPGVTFEDPEIRISHKIKGRVPSAIHKKASELLDHERTAYYERMAFVVRMPEIVREINGNTLILTMGGVRAYNQENLYSKKGLEKFKFFIGFQNTVCCNLCVWTDGYSGEIRVTSEEDLQQKILEIIAAYNADNHFIAMENLMNYYLTEHQFAQLIGKVKLFNHIPKDMKAGIADVMITDAQSTNIIKDYYSDVNFRRNENGNINMWNVYNLFTQANKSSYIDTFLDRGHDAMNISNGLIKAIEGDSEYAWFLD